jgi:hypothetical protein
MIIMRQVEAIESVSVDFDEYVPLTITWSGAGGLLEAPRYTSLQDESGYLEFKFDPSTGILTELVLAAASTIQVEQDNLSPVTSNGINLMPFLDFGDTASEMRHPLVIRAYPDYLYISLGPNPDRWVGSGAVLFGLAGEQAFAAICASWTASERASVLAGRLVTSGPESTISTYSRPNPSASISSASAAPRPEVEAPTAAKPRNCTPWSTRQARTDEGG